MHHSEVFDFVIIGGGIAGASLAYRLAEHASVLVLERESQPGYHSTGRSAAMFMEAYGTPQIQALTRASRAFYEQPPEDFTEHALLEPRGCLYVANAEQQHLLKDTFDVNRANSANVSLIDTEQARALVPCLRPEAITGAMLETDARDLDVHALHQGFCGPCAVRAAYCTVTPNSLAPLASTVSGTWYSAMGAHCTRANW